jgi:type IV pilus assembly protein PilE
MMKTCEKGFTLIELLVVVAILGILAVIATTSYIGVQLKAARSEAYSNLEAIRLLEEQFFAENGEYAPAGGGVLPYNSTDALDGGIEDVLTGFRPGGCRNCAAPFGLSYAYSITSVDSDGDGIADQFTATATAVAGSRGFGKDPVWSINQDNIRNW